MNNVPKNPIKISVKIVGESVGCKIFDYINAARCRINDRPLEFSYYVSGIQSATDLNIVFVAMNGDVTKLNLDDFDLILFSNSDEPLSVSNQYMVENMHRNNAYIVCNSLVHQDHHLRHKILFNNQDHVCTRQYWTNAIFPHCFENIKNKQLPRTQDLVFINGANRSWRHHYMYLLRDHVPALPMLSNISDVIHETDDAPWETDSDTNFREYVNNRYDITRNQRTTYYDNCTSFDFLSAIDGLPKRVDIPPGYEILSEYFTHRCVIFPESSWQNHELAITEKSLKCFFSRSLPFPIGGARTHELYNQIGFKTAWNLLPNNLKEFDAMTDHVARSYLVIDAIKWLADNVQVLQTDQYHDMIKDNFLKCLTLNLDIMTVDRFRDIIENSLYGSSKHKT